MKLTVEATGDERTSPKQSAARILSEYEDMDEVQGTRKDTVIMVKRVQRFHRDKFTQLAVTIKRSGPTYDDTVIRFPNAEVIRATED
jgi:hypothetical protein